VSAGFVLADVAQSEKLNLSTQVQQCDNNGGLKKGNLSALPHEMVLGRLSTRITERIIEGRKTAVKSIVQRQDSRRKYLRRNCHQNTLKTPFDRLLLRPLLVFGNLVEEKKALESKAEVEVVSYPEFCVCASEFMPYRLLCTFLSRAVTRPVLILLPVLGLTWLCGVLVHLSVVVAYVFIALNSLQVKQLSALLLWQQLDSSNQA